MEEGKMQIKLQISKQKALPLHISLSEKYNLWRQV